MTIQNRKIENMLEQKNLEGLSKASTDVQDEDIKPTKSKALPIALTIAIGIGTLVIALGFTVLIVCVFGLIILFPMISGMSSRS